MGNGYALTLAPFHRFAVPPPPLGEAFPPQAPQLYTVNCQLYTGSTANTRWYTSCCPWGR